mmetsp:Transcript_18570/g.24009  ORF Transcript_18570/g.24009 Transcript_18570/m.24009 type:complete len:242 (+) Transcript_18570:476-1201(+)
MGSCETHCCTTSLRAVSGWNRAKASSNSTRLWRISCRKTLPCSAILWNPVCTENAWLTQTLPKIPVHCLHPAQIRPRSTATFQAKGRTTSPKQGLTPQRTPQQDLGSPTPPQGSEGVGQLREAQGIMDLQDLVTLDQTLAATALLGLGQGAMPLLASVTQVAVQLQEAAIFQQDLESHHHSPTKEGTAAHLQEWEVVGPMNLRGLVPTHLLNQLSGYPVAMIQNLKCPRQTLVWGLTSLLL